MDVPPPTAQDLQLDCLGKACPVPVIELAKMVATMDVGQSVTVLSDDPGAKVDIPVWCRMKRQELLDVTDTDGVYRFTVRKAA